MVKVFAPAKINLTLHITGQRDDGYHLLDSLVAFATVGDTLELSQAGVFSLTVEGPEAAGVPADMDNLALRAAHLNGAERKAAITLTKTLPSASGIGGGSADAAAAWRGMLALGDAGDTVADRAYLMPDVLVETQARALLALGADIPMCVACLPVRVQGIGDKLTPHKVPTVPAVLVNPRVPVSTPDVFKALTSKDNSPMPATLPAFETAGDLIQWLHGQRNDLQVSAITIAPEIATVLDRLGQCAGAQLVRMSGSGATCFALFDDVDAAKSAAETLFHERPDWWVAGCMIGDMMKLGLPK